MVTIEPSEYLRPSFDPKKLKISELCSILSQHQISIPAARQKKEFYVELFMKELCPKAESILQDIENVRPSNEGITFVRKASVPAFSKEELDLIENETEPEYLKIPSIATVVEKKKIWCEINSTNCLDAKRKLSDLGGEGKNDFQACAECAKKIKTEDPKSILLETTEGLKVQKPCSPPRKENEKKLYSDAVKVDPPKASRFMIEPTLPGVRGTEKASVSVKKMVTSYEQETLVEKVTSKPNGGHGKFEWKPSSAPMNVDWRNQKISPNPDWKTAPIPKISDWRNQKIPKMPGFKDSKKKSFKKTYLIAFITVVLVGFLCIQFEFLKLSILPEQIANDLKTFSDRTKVEIEKIYIGISGMEILNNPVVKNYYNVISEFIDRFYNDILVNFGNQLRNYYSLISLHISNFVNERFDERIFDFYHRAQVQIERLIKIIFDADLKVEYREYYKNAATYFDSFSADFLELSKGIILILREFLSTEIEFSIGSLLLIGSFVVCSFVYVINIRNY
jgi:hypothetical protein